MINLKRNQIHIALLGILLLIGQLGVLIHSAEHSFHTEEQSCEIFLQCEKSGNGLISNVVDFNAPVAYIHATSRVKSVSSSLSQSVYYARAPPSLS